MASTAFIGAGARFAGDRSGAAGPVVDALIERAGFRCVIFKMLAERTLALALLQRGLSFLLLELPIQIEAAAAEVATEEGGRPR
jgi:hypothetical protein